MGATIERNDTDVGNNSLKLLLGGFYLGLLSPPFLRSSLLALVTSLQFRPRSAALLLQPPPAGGVNSDIGLSYSYFLRDSGIQEPLLGSDSAKGSRRSSAPRARNDLKLALFKMVLSKWCNGKHLGPPAKSGLGPQAGSYKRICGARTSAGTTTDLWIFKSQEQRMTCKFPEQQNTVPDNV
ncbi:hypothetical protein TNCV_606561 [Trichonephila clavipes]|nr:hypothetical protein TNCV_606561 [Trichonephila clavipes]